MVALSGPSNNNNDSVSATPSMSDLVCHMVSALHSYSIIILYCSYAVRLPCDILDLTY